MKPLQVIDVVMLWVARGFTFGLLALFALPLAMTLLAFVLELMTYVAFPAARSHTAFYASSVAIQHIQESPQMLIGLTYALLWFASVRFLQSRAARICVGITSGLLFLGFCSALPGISHLISHWTGHWFTGLILIITLLGATGFGAMLWISIRPPANDPHSRSSADGFHPKPA